MPYKKNTGISRLRIAIPAQMPTYIQPTYLGMPPLPFSTEKPFKAAGIKPEGGKINGKRSINGAGNGGFRVVTEQNVPKRNRKTNQQVSGVKRNGNQKVKSAKTKSKTRNSNTLLKKKPPLARKISRLTRRVRGFLSGRGGRKRLLKRNAQGKFVKG